MPKVGLFFYVNGEVFTDSVDIERAEVYGDFRIGDSSHYKIWDKKYDKIYNKPYDYYPRGRVVFKFKENKYILYIDKCISKKGIQEIIETFGIENENVEIGTDTHYVCKKCNKHYLE